MSDILGTLQGEDQHNAFALLETLNPADLKRVKDFLQLDQPTVVGPTTVQVLAKAASGTQYPLTNAGVNAFKDARGLGNTGALAGVIGAQTAQAYLAFFLPQPVAAGGPGRHINAAGLALIKEFEGCARQLSNGTIVTYLDSVGVPTIGYGHTHDVHLGQSIDMAGAVAFLQQDLHTFETGVSNLVTVPLTDNEFAALVAFSFNVGLGNLKNSNLLELLNGGKPKAAVADQFSHFTRAGGQVLQGLVRRRNAEKALFLTP